MKDGRCYLISGEIDDVERVLQAFETAKDKCEAFRVPLCEAADETGSWPHGEMVTLALTIEAEGEGVDLSWNIFSAWRSLLGDPWDMRPPNSPSRYGCYIERDYKTEALLFPEGAR